jgi:FkbM family methyltransferase
MTVLDIGANIGIYTSFLADLVGPTGRVVAFEPESRNVERLRSGVGSRAQVEVVHAAVTDRSGTIELFVADDLNVDHHTYASDGRRSEKVAAVALDDFVREGERVDLIKMDIQGAEAAALRGARRVLSADPGPALLMEYWPYGLRRAGEDPLALLSFLRTCGFECATVGGAPLPSPDGVDPDRYVNIVAKRRVG